MSEWLTQARLDYQWLTKESVFRPWVEFHPEPTPLLAHVHEGLELGVVLSGREEHCFAEAAIEGRPGDVWLCSSWEPHAWRVLAPRTEIVVLMFLPEFLGEETIDGRPWLSLFVPQAQWRPQTPSEQVGEQVLAIGGELRQEALAQTRGWEDAVRLGVLRLLLTLGRHWEPPDETTQARESRAANLSRIMPALNLLRVDPARPLALSQAAGACGLSRSRFTLLFRRLMGVSFGQFHLQARVGIAARQLLATDLPTDEIAEQTGFAGASHLHRAFVKHHGCTPGQYRRRGGEAPPPLRS